MHKKSMEASQKLKEEEERVTGGDMEEDGGPLSRLVSEMDNEDSRRAESIKLLRAKAQSYSAARMLHVALNSDFNITSSGFQSPSVTMVTTGC